MSKSNAKIREESAAYFNMTTEEREVLRIKDALDKKLAQSRHTVENFKGVYDDTDKNRIFRATEHLEIVIDKERLLNFPLNDPRTSKTVRENYLAQEELMTMDCQITREEEAEVDLSSPARETLQSQIRDSLMVMPQEEYERMKANNWAYLHSVFPEMDDPVIP